MKISKTSIVQQVIEYIGKNIETGAWGLGDKIPSENEMTKILDVSRASVRVALQQFIALGVLNSFHGKGTFVCNTNLKSLEQLNTYISLSDIKDIRKVLEFRIAVEPHICYLAAERGNEELVLKLEKLLQRMHESEGDQKKFVGFDMQFHLEIAGASDNQLLESCLTKVCNEMIHNLEQLNEIYGYQDGINYHTRLVEGFRNKDQNLVKQLMTKHLQQAIDRL